MDLEVFAVWGFDFGCRIWRLGRGLSECRFKAWRHFLQVFCAEVSSNRTLNPLP